MEFREAAAGGIPLISAYGEGGFKVLKEAVDGHLLICPTGFCAWPVKSSKSITKQSFKPLSESGFEAEFLLLGLGSEVSDTVVLARKFEKLLGLPVEVMTTGAAARTYNVLALEGRRVAAALIAV